MAAEAADLRRGLDRLRTVRTGLGRRPRYGVVGSKAEQGSLRPRVLDGLRAVGDEHGRLVRLTAGRAVADRASELVSVVARQALVDMM